MKKALMIVLAAALLLGMTACSQEKLASFMGGMNSNIYGIKADVRVANKAASEVESSVSENENGSYDIDLSKALSVVDYVAEISNSPSKTAALLGRLNQPVATDEEAVEQVKEALVDKIPDSYDTASLAEGREDVFNLIKDVYSDFSSHVQNNVPTYADVAILSVIDMMNTAVRDNNCSTETLNETGCEAASTIKLLSEIGQVDIMGSLDITKFFGNSDKAVSRDENRPMQAFAASMSSVVGLLTENGAFDTDKYASFIYQARLLKSAYELQVYGADNHGGLIELLFPFLSLLFADYDSEDSTEAAEVEETVVEAKKLGFIADDLGRYIVCSTFIAIDNFNDLLSAWEAFLSEYINLNYTALTNFGSAEFEPVSVQTGMNLLDKMGTSLTQCQLQVPDPTEEDPENTKTYEYVSSSTTIEDKTASLVEGLMALIYNTDLTSSLETVAGAAGRAVDELIYMLNTMGIIVLDCDYESLFPFLSNLILDAALSSLEVE